MFPLRSDSISYPRTRSPYRLFVPSPRRLLSHTPTPRDDSRGILRRAIGIASPCKTQRFARREKTHVDVLCWHRRMVTTESASACLSSSMQRQFFSASQRLLVAAANASKVSPCSSMRMRAGLRQHRIVVLIKVPRTHKGTSKRTASEVRDLSIIGTRMTERGRAARPQSVLQQSLSKTIGCSSRTPPSRRALVSNQYLYIIQTWNRKRDLRLGDDVRLCTRVFHSAKGSFLNLLKRSSRSACQTTVPVPRNLPDIFHLYSLQSNIYRDHDVVEHVKIDWAEYRSFAKRPRSLSVRRSSQPANFDNSRTAPGILD